MLSHSTPISFFSRSSYMAPVAIVAVLTTSAPALPRQLKTEPRRATRVSTCRRALGEPAQQQLLYSRCQREPAVSRGRCPDRQQLHPKRSWSVGYGWNWPPPPVPNDR